MAAGLGAGLSFTVLVIIALTFVLVRKRRRAHRGHIQDHNSPTPDRNSWILSKKFGRFKLALAEASNLQDQKREMPGRQYRVPEVVPELGSDADGRQELPGSSTVQ